MRVKINIDGGSRGNPGPAASGFVITSADGGIIAGEGVCIGRATNNRAEYYALHLALECALARGAREAEVFSDSKLLVCQFNGTYRIKDSGLFGMMVEIKRLAAGLRAVKLVHVPRELNKKADALVNAALDAEEKNPHHKKVTLPAGETAGKPVSARRAHAAGAPAMDLKTPLKGGAQLELF